MLMKSIDQSALQKGIEILKRGGVVIFPTDTAFGIGCRIDNEEAVKRIFAIKKREESQAVPILVTDETMAESIVEPIPQEVVEKLIIPFWPGGLTVVLVCKKEKVSPLLRGNGDTIGVRSPNHEIMQTLIREVGVPLVGTSANFHGKKTPFKAEDLDPHLVSLVDYVVPGESFGMMASTIIDCSIKPWKIIRKGAVDVHIIILSIDTTSNKKISVSLMIDGREDNIVQELNNHKTQIVLPLIEKLLKKHQLVLSDITEIMVNRGPGSYTGVRVGVAIANALSFALRISVNGKLFEGKNPLVEPLYG